MKNWIIGFLVASSLLMNQACSNNKDAKPRADEENVTTEQRVPTVVKTSFTAKYPGATELIWEDASEGDDPTVKVKFKLDGKYWKAEFRKDGSFVKEKQDD
ncbi:MAG: hypothetical protein ABIR30_07040 [Chitinophagaceae bacterium]